MTFNGNIFNPSEVNPELVMQLKRIRWALYNLTEEAMTLQEALADIIVEIETGLGGK